MPAIGLRPASDQKCGAGKLVGINRQALQLNPGIKRQA